ncbi:MAG: glycosyltransferase family 2 protein [Ignavibacteria bacterium]|nr:glycosyltransferase family 2 protein [Ignavibacteria bacterium]MBK7252928.1 glycosyltransferase family 2 protein [Ignavibacteria bacterium]
MKKPEDNNNPRVSIIIPTYNRVKMLEKSIESVFAQSYKDWELIIIDDASNDETEERMKQLSSREKSVRYMRIPKIEGKGISEYLNIGLRNSKGEYIARIDDDDFWCHKDKLKMQVEFLDENPEYVVVGGGVILVDENGTELFRYLKKETDEEIRRFALFSNPFTHATVMFRKETAMKLGGYRIMKHVEDMELWLRMGKVGKLYNMKEYFITYMTAGQNKSFLQQRENSRTVVDVVKMHGKHYPNFRKAYTLNYIQYSYSFLPVFIKKHLQSFMYYFKRKNF